MRKKRLQKKKVQEDVHWQKEASKREKTFSRKKTLSHEEVFEVTEDQELIKELKKGIDDAKNEKGRFVE